MKANVVLRKFFKKHGTKKLAATLGLSAPFLYKWCQPDGGKATGGWNPLARVAALTAATGDGMLLDHLCTEAGGRFVRPAELPALARRCREQILTELNQVLKSEERSKEPEVRSQESEVSPALGKGSRCQPEGFRSPAGGSRCQYRRPGGRCGFPARKLLPSAANQRSRSLS